MRLLFTLLLLISVLGPAHAGELIDRPLLKMKLNASAGWRLDAVQRWEREKDIWGDRQKNRDVVVIEGRIINDSAQERVAPKVRVRVLDQDGREIFHWTVLSDLARIKPGDNAPFRTRLESPPSGMHAVEISMVEQN